jgi:uncharacterized Zn finger protein
MKITDSARCPECTDSLGKPQDVVEENDKQFTVYECNSCTGEWYRSH